MRRSLSIAVLILVFALVAAVVWVSNHLDSIVEQSRLEEGKRETVVSPSPGLKEAERVPAVPPAIPEHSDGNASPAD